MDEQASEGRARPMIPYAELQVASSFTFLEGASHPGELASMAARLGHAAIGVADRNTLAGIVQMHAAAKEAGIRPVIGCRLDLTDADSLLAYPTDRAAYARLSRLLTLGKMRAPKGECFLARADVLAHAEGMLFLLLPPDRRDPSFVHELRAWRGGLARGQLHLAASHRYRGDDARRLHWLAGLAAAERVPLVATNDVLCHHPSRRALADVLTCIRHHTSIDAAGWRLAANVERHLKAGVEMARLFRDHPDAVARTVEIADACRFSLDELRYEYPDEVAEGRDPQETLVALTWAGADKRYPAGVPDPVRETVARELALIGQLGYAPYFLTVHDIVRFARGIDILCQGRGSAANSAVCYCLGVTEVNPTEVDLLFERFISTARNEPPDIDVDFEHERREEVIQHIYKKYGRHRAGLTATVIRYRARAALRDVGKAMGLSADLVARLTGSIWGWSSKGIDAERARRCGVDPDDPRLRQTLELAEELIGFPRHLSQHVGGFVITRGPLSDLCPVANAAMEDRTTIEWDKDDIDALGILKVDVLALGMLTCLRRAFDLIERHHGGPRPTLASLPPDDGRVYEMLGRADSLGVFQVESRAQMAMLPRLKPRNFYDLVVEVAIVRPGPIQGGMVHPYLRRRGGAEEVTYPMPQLEPVLRKTYGVPLFQEQAMKIAMVGAGFSAADADRLRRAMASFRKAGDVHRFREKFIAGMLANGCPPDFAERCFKQIEGFGEYGFPESHAASFALLVYVSAWIKCHHPVVFAAALLNSQPMGFYAPAQIVRDAREHGVTVLPPDVNRSDWDCTLEPTDPDAPPLLPPGEKVGMRGFGAAERRHAAAPPHPAPLPGGEKERKAEGFGLRLGFRLIKGFTETDAKSLVLSRASGYRDAYDLWRRSRLPVAALERLARADAFRSVGLDRRAALWAVRALGDSALPLFARLDGNAVAEPEAALPAMPLGEHVVMDYGSLSLSLKSHPLALLRDGLPGVSPSERLAATRDGRRLTVAGLVLVRQRPGSAEGVVFLTLEDETGIANLVVMPDLFEIFRRPVMTARLLAATGRVQNHEGVAHLRVETLVDLTHRLGELMGDFAPGQRTGALDRSDQGVFPSGRNFH